MGRPKKREASSGSGCFSGVLKVLLCKGSLEEHHYPNDIIITKPKTTPFRELKKVAELKPPPPAAAGGAPPGVVARLMGLDSLPVDTKWAGPLSEVVRRSRSVNFMDYLLLELDYSKPQQREEEEEEAGGVLLPRHRRVRTSVSFREVLGPVTPRTKQNHLVVLVSDSKERAIKKISNPEVGSSARQKQKAKTENFTRREVVVRKEKSQPKDEKKVAKMANKEVTRQASTAPPRCVQRKKVVPAGRSPEARGPMLVKLVNHEKEVLVESKFMKQMKQEKKKKKKKTNKRENNGNGGEVEEESVFSCEGSSPVSVLDLKETSPTRRRQLSFSDDVRIKDPSSKKNCSIQIEKSGGHEAVKRKDCCGLVENRGVEKEYYHVELARKLLKLTEAELEESIWVKKAVSGSEFQGLEEICSEFGSDLFDHLLFQVVQELVGSTICI